MRKALFILALLVLSLLVAELILQGMAKSSFTVATLLDPPWASPSIPRTIPDDKLIYRPNPAYPQYDKRGWRNPIALNYADIAVLGDSQTFGTGVMAHEAWPAQLSQMTQLSVYSMAYGGYNPVHYAQLIDEALALSPKLVIVALYLGKDAYGAYQFVYEKGLRPDFKTPSEIIQSEIELTKDFPSLASAGYDKLFGTSTNGAQKLDASWLSQNSKLYGLARRLRWVVKKYTEDPWRKALNFAFDRPHVTEVFNNDQYKTILTSQYRLSALNLSDPLVLEGIKISHRAIQEIHEKVQASDAKLIVVMIPSKEMAFYHLAKDSATPHYQGLMSNEAVAMELTAEYLEERGIPYIDVTPTLRSAFKYQQQPYRVDHDGHPNFHGHAAIASYIGEEIMNGRRESTAESSHPLGK